jgi:hypothetical protein
MLARGWIEKGGLVADPFGGIGTGGIVCAANGLRWLGCELEVRFVDLANRNFQLNPWTRNGEARIIQGDSRAFASLIGQCQACVTSPPFVNDGIDHACTNVGNKVNRNQQCVSRGRPKHIGGDQQAKQISYGKTAGQLSSLPVGDVGAILTSPPYAGSTTVDGRGITDHQTHTRDIGDIDELNHGYGVTEGQLGAMKDSVDSFRKALTIRAWPTTPNISSVVAGGSNIEPQAGVNSATIGSSPETKSGQTSDGETTVRPTPDRITGIGKAELEAGEEQARLGLCEKSERDAETSANDAGHRKGKSSYTTSKTGMQPAELGTTRMPTSSFFVEHATISGTMTNDSEGTISRNPPQLTISDSSDSKENIPSLESASLNVGEISSVITSPPWEKSDQRGSQESKVDLLQACKRDGKGHGDDNPRRYVGNDYGEANGQLGNTSGDTYWSAVAEIYRQCFLALKPGGHIACVVKSYVKAGKIVPLPDQTWELLQHVGFEPVERVRAMLVKEDSHPGLFEGPVVKKTERKSFFRRLAERKGSPAIDFEEVLFCRKPV